VKIAVNGFASVLANVRRFVRMSNVGDLSWFVSHIEDRIENANLPPFVMTSSIKAVCVNMAIQYVYFKEKGWLTVDLNTFVNHLNDMIDGVVS